MVGLTEKTMGLPGGSQLRARPAPAIHRSAGRERRSVFPAVDVVDEGIQLKNILRRVDGNRWRFG